MRESTFRILVTNDDGVASDGLAVLANHLAAAGHDVTVAAPSAEASGSAAAIGGIMPGDEFHSRQVELAQATTPYPAFAVDGPPGRAVLAAALGAFGPPPEFVISGINPGANVGRFLQLHSGTLGAGLTAAGMGMNALAVSIENSEPTHWDSAGALATRLMGYLSACAPRTTLNLNSPDLPLDQIKGLRTAPVRSERSVRLTLTGESPGVHVMGHEPIESNAKSSSGQSANADSDASLVKDGYAVLTQVAPPSDVPIDILPEVFV